MTEKSTVLSSLKDSESNACLKKFNLPKYVFMVDRTANKQEIAKAVEEIYAVQVVSVNTLIVKPKARRVRGRAGFTKSFKKAIVTLRAEDQIDNV